MPRLKKYEEEYYKLAAGYFQDLRERHGLRIDDLRYPKDARVKQFKEALAVLLYNRLSDDNNYRQVAALLAAKLYFNASELVQILYLYNSDRDRFDRLTYIEEPKIGEELTVNDYYFNHLKHYENE